MIKNSMSGFKMLAFGLAEVMLCVGMVGMVSMLLIPGMLENYKEQATIVGLKRAYALTSNAFNSSVADNGTPDGWKLSNSGDPAGLPNLNRIMAENLNVVKNCETGPGCFADVKYKDLVGTENPEILNQSNNYTKMLLSDGSSIALTSWSSNCDFAWGDSTALRNVCGMIGVDINGSKAPNKYGEDYFGFVMTKYGILPMGTPGQNKYQFDDFCNLTSAANTNSENGLSCSAWLLYNDNNDYQKCDTLSWTSNTTCNAPTDKAPPDNGNICTGKNDNNNDNNGKNNKNFKNGNDNVGNNGNNNCNGNY